uniref:Agenet domain-containing protein n=1 Tax=Ananas comosus var. bracteatus TaxID=296719 RepID=A0A6V7PLS7_ANACO|nr:unnamed protein product [Ananas comosus var. bracteatus]
MEKKKKKKKPKPQERGPSGFPTGAAVEVQSDDEGFRSAWYEAAVLSHNRRRGRYRVAYTTLLDDDSDEHHGPSSPSPSSSMPPTWAPALLPPQQAKEGYKVDKGFKKPTYVAVAKAVNTRFGTDFNTENVDNHMRTLRSKYVEIKKCQDISGAGWDEQQKMIILEGETYQTYIKAHPKVADILNRPIKYYEELRIICGDDQATGYFKSSLFDEFGENNNETFSLEYQKNDNEREDEVEEIDGRFAQAEGARQAPNNKASSLPSRARSSAKRAREDPYLVDLVSCVGEVANALKRSAAVTEKVTTHWMEELFTKIKEISGYKSEIYKAVFEYLCQSEMQARVFMTKDLDMQHSWFKRSVTTHFSDLGGFL